MAVLAVTATALVRAAAAPPAPRADDPEIAYYLTVLGVPGDAADEPALRAAAQRRDHDRAVFDLARSAGVTDAGSLTELLNRRAVVNAETEARIAAGEVVYGAADYDVPAFHGRMMAALRSGTVSALSTGPSPSLTVSDADVAAYVAAHPADWSAGGTSRMLTRLHVPASARVSEATLTAALGSGRTLEEIARSVDGATLRSVRWSPEQFRGLRVSPSMRQELRDLTAGRTTSVETYRGGWIVYRLDRTDVDQASAVRAAAPAVSALLLDQRFDALVDQRLAQTSAR